MLSPAEIQELIAESGIERTAPAGLSVKATVQTASGKTFKLRGYPDPDTAQDRVHYLEICDRMGIRTPAVAGAWDRFVVFKFVPLAPSAADTRTLEAIGQILGRLNTIPARRSDPEALIDEPGEWLTAINGQRFLPRGSNQPIIARLKALCPPEAPVVMDYWDAMPHNFGWDHESLVLVDEKHLRDSFPGVGLIKPMLVFPRSGWEAMRSGYAGAGSSRFVEAHLPFLTYYYLLAALHFYALAAAANRIVPGNNHRLIRYRHMLMEQTPGLGVTRRALADLQFLAAHRRALLLVLRSRFGLLDT